MRVGLDLDECLYPFVLTWRQWANVKVRPAEEWAFYERDGYTTESYLNKFAQGVDAGIIFATGKPIWGAWEMVDRLHSAGHTIHLVTDRSVGVLSQANTEKWLRHWQFHYDSLTYAKNKTVVRTDAFLDDKPQNVDELRAVGCAAFLFDRGRTDQVGHPYLVRSLEEFEQRISDIEDGIEVGY